MGLAAGLVVLSCFAMPAWGQDPAPPAAPPTTGYQPSPEILARVRTSLEVEPLIRDNAPRFYVEVVHKQPTITDWLKGADLGGGGGGGLNVGDLVMDAVRKLKTAIRNYQVRKIRERIDRELAALQAAQ